MKYLSVLYCCIFGLLSHSQAMMIEIPQQMVSAPSLGCELFEYEHTVVQVDTQGRKCFGDVIVLSCRGRCDSKEISDWKFPHKKAFHPVCLHNEKVTRSVRLPNCHPDVDPGTDIYEFVEAKSCKCQVCSPDKANCIGQSPASKPNHPNFPFPINGKRIDSSPFSLNYMYY